MGQVLLLTEFHRRGDTLESSMEVLIDSLPPDARRSAVSGRQMESYTGNLVIR